MAYSTNRFENPFGFTLTTWVKRLILANAGVWVIALLLRLSGAGGVLEGALAMTPVEVLRKPWTLVTYMFVHAGFLHLLFNMLGLFFFGPPLEERWGGKGFLRFYLVAGLGGALLSFITPHVPIVGASAAVYGVMMAYAMYWPDNPVYIWGIFPVKVKWLVAFIVAMTVLGSLSGGGGVAYLAHLGGLATAFLYLKSPWAPSPWGEVPASRRKSGKVRSGGGLSFGWLRRRKAPAPASAPTATPTPTPQKPAGATNRPRDEQQLLDDVDRILEKISARGLGSLTEEERKRLDEVSRRYRSN